MTARTPPACPPPVPAPREVAGGGQPQPTRPDVCLGGHHAYADRTHNPWHWACTNCPATRAQGYTTWAAP